MINCGFGQVAYLGASVSLNTDHSAVGYWGSHLVHNFHFSVVGMQIICLGFHCKRVKTKIQISYF